MSFKICNHCLWERGGQGNRWLGNRVHWCFFIFFYFWVLAGADAGQLVHSI